MRRAVRLASLGVAAVLVAGGSWFAYTHVVRQRVIAAALPAFPAGLGTELTAALADAETEALSWRHGPAGLAQLAALYHANGHYPEAIACYEALLRLAPAEARWPHLLAGIYADFGQLDAALPLRQKAVALALDYLPARLRLGDVLLKTNRTAEAAAAYDEALRRDPNNPYALLGLARCDLAKDDWSRARARLEAAVAAQPDFIGGLSLLVTVAEHFGDHATANTLRTTIGRREFTDVPDPWLDALADACYDPYRLSVAAAVASAAGDRTTALARLDRAIVLAPRNGAYHRQAGQMLLNDRNHAPARAHLEQAVALNPADADAWVYLLQALRGLGQENAAVEALQRALRHCPESPSLHLESARWLKATGRLAESAAEFEYACRLRPSAASPYVELASVYFALHRDADALRALEQALERQPGHPMALATLTFHAISQGDDATALARWAQVRAQPKTPPEVVRGLRQAYRQKFGRDLP
jgi:tetratricopeptide (TPR) repeat protein